EPVGRRGLRLARLDVRADPRLLLPGDPARAARKGARARAARRRPGARDDLLAEAVPRRRPPAPGRPLRRRARPARARPREVAAREGAAAVRRGLGAARVRW